MEIFCAHVQFPISPNRDVRDKERLDLREKFHRFVCMSNCVVPLEAVTPREASWYAYLCDLGYPHLFALYECTHT